jgi:chorismate dehydratase
MSKVKISVVSYLNSQPFVYGLKKSPPEGMELSSDIPSECARKLISGEADIGLVPVAVLKQLPEFHIVSKYCIGANGAVDSVKLYSQVPLAQIDKIVLDYQSRTSVALTRVLAKELWNIAPEWIAAEKGFESQISGTTAAVVIGDRTFGMNGKFPIEKDLPEEWKQLTGMPFVFAVWASRTPQSDEFVQAFESSLAEGFKAIDSVIADQQIAYPETDVRKYLTQSISYEFDARKAEAMKLFLSKL